MLSARGCRVRFGRPTALPPTCRNLDRYGRPFSAAETPSSRTVIVAARNKSRSQRVVIPYRANCGGYAVTGSGSRDATTILVVDDEPALSMLACDYLRDAGYRALEAHSAQQAIDLLETGEQVHVVFSDVQMPGMDGFDLQRWLRQHRPQIRILLCSGVEAVKIAGGYLGPPRWLIYKPYDMAALERRIRSLLGEPT